MVDLLLGGDFYAPGGFRPRVAQGVRRVIGGATHSFVNLEGPATGSTTRISKSGPAIASAPGAVSALAEMGWTGVVTANNHIMDAGPQGLRDTLDECARVGFGQVGSLIPGHPTGGLPYVDLVLEDGQTLRVLAFCEREWSVDVPGFGAVGWSVVTAARGITEARALGFRVVVVLHGGNEYFPLPRPRLREELRYLAEVGADAIIMHHTHVASAYEYWCGVPICYGLGNFQFAMENPRFEWFEGLLAGLTFPEGGTVLELTPLTISEDFGVEVATDVRADEILGQVEGYRLQVQSDEALGQSWKDFSASTGAALLAASTPRRAFTPRRLQGVFDRANLSRLEADEARLLTLTNVLRCESLSDAAITYLWSQVRPE